MIKGRNDEFVKFRSTRVKTKNRTRTDTSFHNEPDKISTWISLLEEESMKHGEQIYRGVPELLRLVRIMMSQNATLRPTAREVRDRIEEILVGECGVDHLCCTGREWSEFDKSDLKDEPTSQARRGRHDSPLQDDLSMPMGVLSVDTGRKGSDAGPRAASVLDKRLGAAEQDAKTQSELTDAQQRRRSSASTVTAKVSSWKMKIFSGRGGIAA